MEFGLDVESHHPSPYVLDLDILYLYAIHLSSMPAFARIHSCSRQSTSSSRGNVQPDLDSITRRQHCHPAAFLVVTARAGLNLIVMHRQSRHRKRQLCHTIPLAHTNLWPSAERREFPPSPPSLPSLRPKLVGVLAPEIFASVAAPESVS